MSEEKSTLSRFKSTKYVFQSKEYGKARLVLAVIQYYVKQHPNISFEDLIIDFPKKTQGVGLFIHSEVALERANSIGLHRSKFFIKSEEFITLSDCRLAVSNQWGTRNISLFITAAAQIGYVISIV